MSSSFEDQNPVRRPLTAEERERLDSMVENMERQHEELVQKIEVEQAKNRRELEQLEDDRRRREEFDEKLRNRERLGFVNVQDVAASQIEVLEGYHNAVLTQARKSFNLALVAAAIGLCFFLAAVVIVLSLRSSEIAVISLISGALVQVIAGINFYLYGKSAAQLAEFQSRIDQTQRFLLANSVCERLMGDFKQKARSDLVRAMAGMTKPIGDGNKQTKEKPSKKPEASQLKS